MSEEFKSPFGLPIQTPRGEESEEQKIEEPIIDEAPMTERGMDLDALIKALFSHSQNRKSPIDNKETDREKLQKHFKMILELLKHGK